ncbi:MAG: response regulator transcription factor [Anaerolineae bacterium]|jgi:two-component system KDP operon response regulator KdpE|nr:response regulator transcription factor [Anaerolineae bacterium]
MQAFLYLPESVEAASLKAGLQSIGFLVKTARTPEEMLEHWPHAAVDLVILSVEGIDESLLNQIHQIRIQANSAIIAFTEFLPEKEKILLYDAGVDLVIDRPYSVSLLLAQIKSMQRRVTGVPYFTLPVLTIDDLVLDPSSRTVQVNGTEPTRLTQLEFRLLYTLMTHPGQVLSAEMLVESVWGYSDTGNRELVRGLVKRLRRKVEENPRQPQYIGTAPGVGYLFLVD